MTIRNTCPLAEEREMRIQETRLYCSPSLAMSFFQKDAPVLFHHVHHLIPLYCLPCCFKRKEAQSRFDQAFDARDDLVRSGLCVVAFAYLRAIWYDKKRGLVSTSPNTDPSASYVRTEAPGIRRSPATPLPIRAFSGRCAPACRNRSSGSADLDL
jgi:hypothetical protein